MKGSFSLRIPSVNVTKSAVSCRFAYLKVSFFMQCGTIMSWKAQKDYAEEDLGLLQHPRWSAFNNS